MEDIDTLAIYCVPSNNGVYFKSPQLNVLSRMNAA